MVGGGISGLAAAHALSRTASVTLIEAEPRLGGHARTIMAGKRGDQPVDTGFIVFNKVNYPNLTRLFEELSVPIADSDMSFAASFGNGALEYSTQTIDTMFAQRGNLVKPQFLRMVRDILRWNAKAADAARDTSLSLRDFLDEMGLGQSFRDWYLGPISGAIWSTPSQDVMDFPAAAMVKFFANHHLLSASGQHQWYTVEGGSTAYVSRLEAHLRNAGVDIRLGSPVKGIRRTTSGPEVKLTGGDWEFFDDVILATHSDDSLALLSDPSAEEQALLGNIRYQPNTAITHCDAGLMPKRRKVWAAWNYAEPGGTKPDHIGLTYWMNRLQPIPQDDPLFVTLNPQTPIREEAIYDQVAFRHPVYDLAMMEAVAKLRDINGTRNTWFCGAWMHNGFHEDGFRSALDVVARLERDRSLSVAAE
ncbi:cyclopropane-fatty-acyl-phospholipid synthase [Jannaschia pagri]|uniref:Cyclopropane-fatty-acyl-phospholipid synthase n=1 Tax=Jannaschia pagri TaxID=2829797 RepID=A0ABQ4NQT2_9RHOB|nr:cyclopropane-fatty-acyl-phospholipid synthase [Jannaschia sp. AI_61]GIT96770.1 cyclopropane-fatty-acyl-phospholipid synthase [Jannaschia sp. AI_62]